jgi:hypothetical protein
MDPVTSEGWWGVARGASGIAGAVAIAWHCPSVAMYALGVIALAVAPGLAKAIIAPRVAALLRDAQQKGE